MNRYLSKENGRIFIKKFKRLKVFLDHSFRLALIVFLIRDKSYDKLKYFNSP